MMCLPTSRPRPPRCMQLFEDPVSTKFGHSYERTAIMKALRVKPCDPLTQQPLRPSEVTPNFALRDAIAAYRSQHGLPSPRVAGESGGKGEEKEQGRPVAVRQPDDTLLSSSFEESLTESFLAESFNSDSDF